MTLLEMTVDLWKQMEKHFDIARRHVTCEHARQVDDSEGEPPCAWGG
jgi:hypothetical protein